MFKFFATVSYLLLSGFPLFAVPIGNPSAPSVIEEGFFIPDISWTNVQSGVLGDWLSQQRFITKTGRAELKGNSQIGNVTWNLAERLNLQIEMGSGWFEWRWKQSEHLALDGRLSGGILWSGSAKLVIFEIKDTSLAADVHVGGWDWMKGYAAVNGIPLGSMDHSKMRYWQFGGALCQKVGFLIPYIGLAANRTRLKINKLESGIGWFQSLHALGPFLGCTLSKGTDIALNIEWRGGFEQGTAVSGQIRF